MVYFATSAQNAILGAQAGYNTFFNEFLQVGQHVLILQDGIAIFWTRIK